MGNIRIYAKNEDGYLKMQMFCNEMNMLTDDEHEFFVKDGYYDQGLDWKWTAPCCSGSNGKKNSQWWVLSPREYDEILESKNFSDIQKVAWRIINRMRDKETSIPGKKSPYGRLLDDMEIAAKRSLQYINENNNFFIFYDDVNNPTEGIAFISDLNPDEVFEQFKHDENGLVNSFINIQMTAGFAKMMVYSTPEKIQKFVNYTCTQAQSKGFPSIKIYQSDDRELLGDKDISKPEYEEYEEDDIELG